MEQMTFYQNVVIAQKQKSLNRKGGMVDCTLILVFVLMAIKLMM
jgi:hypothetical protein